VIVLATCCLVVVVLCSAHIDQMFLDGHLGYAGALRGVIGRNYLRQDLVATRFAPLQNAGPTLGSEPSVRTNHPPLSGMLVGLSFAVLGPGEAAARLVPLVASLLTVLLLFAWVRRVWGTGTAVAAACLWSISPYVAIYGAMASYEPLVLLTWNLLLWAWARWHAGDRPRRSMVWAGSAVIAGVWTDWPAVVLVSGLVAVEVVLVASRRPRRPAMALVLGLTLVAALAALAAYDLVVLDVSGGRFQALYAMRSSLGRWDVADVAAHIAHRTAVLLTWPLVGAAGAGLAGLVAGMLRPDGRLVGPGRVLLPLGLLVPPFALLVLLPQHAVIHCFSAWYLLPAAVVSGGAALAWLARTVARRWGAVAGSAPVIAFLGVTLWQAALVTADGWISDGSPLEGRPRLDYRHLALARWARSMTNAGDVLVIDPATKVTGVRAWFQHDRVERRIGPHDPLDRAVGRSGGTLVLTTLERVDRGELRALLEEMGLVFMDDVLVLDTRRPRTVDVLELREERPTAWWLFAHSPCYPPYRFVRAPARREAYRRQLLGARPAALPRLDVARASLAELAARALLEPSGVGSGALGHAVLGRLSFRIPTSERRDCRGIAWEGGQVESTKMGATTVHLVFRTERELPDVPQVHASLTPTGTGRVQRWIVRPDDLFAWPVGALVVATRRFTAGMPPAGRYRLDLACGRTIRGPTFEIESRTALPVMRPVGRL
jgi:hypothetical protein